MGNECIYSKCEVIRTWGITVNMPPMVDAGSGLGITLPDNTVILNGSVWDDGLPSGILQVTWQVVNGSGDVVFGDVHQAVTTAVFIEAILL